MARFGKYKLQQLLGQRLCYSLYEALDSSNGRTVRLKIVNSEVTLGSKEEEDRFLRSGKLLRTLQSEWICQVYDCGKIDGRYFLVLEAAEGMTLNDLPEGRRLMPFEAVMSTVKTVASGLHQAHLKGVVHGLLTPKSIYIPGEGRVKIDDFGIHLFLPPDKWKVAQSRCIAPFIAPELLQRTGSLDGRADVYSLGAIMFHLAYGRSPQMSGHDRAGTELGKNSSIRPALARNPILKHALDDFFAKALHRSPENRFVNMKSFVAGIDYLKDPRSKSIHAVGSDKNLSSWGGRLVSGVFPIVAILALVVVLILLVLPSDVSREQQSPYGPVTATGPKNLPAPVTEPKAMSNGSEPILRSEAAESKSSAVPDSMVTTPVVQKPPAEISPRPTTYLKIIASAGPRPVVADVIVNGWFKGRTNSQGTLLISNLQAYGLGQVEVLAEGYKSSMQEIELSRYPSQLYFDLVPEPQAHYGTLSLEALPGADSVYVDGQLQRGQPPIDLKVPPGAHRVRFVNNELGRSWETNVSVETGDTAIVTHDFFQMRFGWVLVSLQNAAEVGFGFVNVDGKPLREPNKTPLKLTLPVGLHKIELVRDGFITIPPDTLIVVESNITKAAFFRMFPAQN